MKRFKKVCAVALSAAMTFAMTVSSFADQTVTFHFENAKNWETVGAWIYEGVAWETCVTDSYVKCTKADGSVKNLWPGAKCEDEGNGWVKVFASFTDSATGAAMIFNNFVGDAEINATTEEDDVEAIKASGIKTTETAVKEQTSDIILTKRNAFKNGIPSEVWISYEADHNKTTVSLRAPNDYKVVEKPDDNPDEDKKPEDEKAPDETTTSDEDATGGEDTTGEFTVGDVTGEGDIDVKDAAMLKRYLVGWDVKINTKAADVNGDDAVDMKDAAILKRYLAGWDVKLGK